MQLTAIDIQNLWQLADTRYREFVDMPFSSDVIANGAINDGRRYYADLKTKIETLRHQHLMKGN